MENKSAITPLGITVAERDAMTAEEISTLATQVLKKREPRKETELDDHELYALIEEKYLEATRSENGTDVIRLSPFCRSAMRYKVENVYGRIFTKKEVDRFFRDNCYVFEIFDEYENDIRDENGSPMYGFDKQECVLLVDVALYFGLENTLDALHATMHEDEAMELKNIFSDCASQSKPRRLDRTEYETLMAKMVEISTREGARI